jgi:hypothetical protein
MAMMLGVGSGAVLAAPCNDQDYCVSLDPPYRATAFCGDDALFAELVNRCIGTVVCVLRPTQGGKPWSYVTIVRNGRGGDRWCGVPFAATIDHHCVEKTDDSGKCLP